MGSPATPPANIDLPNTTSLTDVSTHSSRKRIYYRAKRSFRYLHLKPFDTSSEAGRAQERYRRAALSSASGFMANGIRMSMALVTVPLAFNYLGAERYGMWLTIISLVSFLNFADLGLGDGLNTALAAAIGRDDVEKQKSIVSSAFFLVAALTSFIALSFVVAFPFVPWDRLFNVTSRVAIDESSPAIAAFFACWVFTLMLNLMVRVNAAFQKAFINNFWDSAGNTASLITLVLFIKLELSLPWLILALGGTLAVARGLNGLALFFKHRPWLRPKFSAFSFGEAKHLVQVGISFCFIQISYIVVLNSTNIIIAQLRGPSEVPQFGIPFRLFAIATVLSSAFIFPLWPAFSEAIARGDHRWAALTLRRALLSVAVVCTAFLVLMTTFGDRIVHLWVGPEITPSPLLLLVLGLWTVFWNISSVIGIFLYATNAVSFVSCLHILEAIAVILSGIALVKFYGIVGMAWALLSCHVVFRSLPLIPRLYLFLGLMRSK